MKSKELKLRNKVTLKKSVTVDENIVTINLDNIGSYLLLQPIPITEEWLLKFGFEKGKNFWLLNESEEGFVDHMVFDLERLEFIITQNPYSGYCVECKYVHQLQNLYFALCGEELKLKDDANR